MNKTKVIRKTRMFSDYLWDDTIKQKIQTYKGFHFGKIHIIMYNGFKTATYRILVQG